MATIAESKHRTDVLRKCHSDLKIALGHFRAFCGLEAPGDHLSEIAKAFNLGSPDLDKAREFHKARLSK